jgi:hypothetical protein
MDDHFGSSFFKNCILMDNKKVKQAQLFTLTFFLLFCDHLTTLTTFIIRSGIRTRVEFCFYCLPSVRLFPVVSDR